MRIAWTAILILPLAGCMTNNYAPASGVTITSSKQDDLMACSKEAQARYFAARHAEGDPGVMLGPVGAVAVASVPNATSPDASLSNIDPNIDACMHAKGYTGTGSG